MMFDSATPPDAGDPDDFLGASHVQTRPLTLTTAADACIGSRSEFLMADGVLQRLMIRFGVPAGQSPRFYRDVGLGAVFAITALLAVALASEAKYTVRFWIVAGTAASSLYLSTNRLALIVALLWFAAIRFALALILSQNVWALVGLVTCSGLAFVLTKRGARVFIASPSLFPVDLG